MLIAVIGKGGAGKTTVTALLLRRLLDARHVPVLAVDADPSNCLGPMLGLAIDRTLADLRDGMRDTPDRPASMSQAEWLSIRAEEALIENNGFDLLTMGHPEGPGCYCFVNNVIRGYLDRLTRSYKFPLKLENGRLSHGRYALNVSLVMPDGERVMDSYEMTFEPGQPQTRPAESKEVNK